VNVLLARPIFVEDEDNQSLELQVVGLLEVHCAGGGLVRKLEAYGVDFLFGTGGLGGGDGKLLERQLEGDFDKVVHSQALAGAHEGCLVGESRVKEELLVLEVEESPEVPSAGDLFLCNVWCQEGW
jgi:hypothetical protein